MTGLYDELAKAIRDEDPVALVSVIAGPGAGSKLLIRPEGDVDGTLGDPDLDRVVVRDARGELAAGTTAVRRYGEHGEARESVVAVRAWLDQVQAHWDEQLRAFGAYVERAHVEREDRG